MYDNGMRPREQRFDADRRTRSARRGDPVLPTPYNKIQARGASPPRPGQAQPPPQRCNNPGAMPRPGVHLQYSFESHGQRGADIDHPLFDLLGALHQHGSIRHAAAATGASYRHVWGALKRWEQALAQPLVVWAKGQPARLTPYALRLLAAERQARVRMTPHIEALRAELERVPALALDEHLSVLEVYASHDLALPLLRDLAAARGLHLALRFAGSVDALRALAQRRCTVAGFHVPALPAGSPVFAAALKPLLRPGRHKLIGALRRTLGLMLRPGLGAPPATLADAARAGLRWINRQPGSGTRLLMEHLRAEAGLDAAALPGWDKRVEHTHVAVAAALAHAEADVGPGVEAAARTAGLGFVPLVTEDYHLVCLADALDTPPLLALRALLASADWATAVGALPGCTPSAQAGRVLSLTRALPWWHYARARHPRRQATSPA
jgi:putative molybdopterin biosynthesis protein